jgi:hypothetical protein
MPGAHACLGGCGRQVSANKRKCLRCLAAEVHENLIAEGVDSDEDDIRRLILVHSEEM